ncbi:unnamed protein product [Closterium sp. NIES-53]
MASWKSTSTYVGEVPPTGANIVSGMWIFKVKRLPGSLPAFKACYIARGFSQREGVDFFQTFSPTPKMTNLRVLLHVAARRDYELHSLDLVFATADTTALALVKAELQERHTYTDLDELRSYLGLQITRDKARRTITLNQSHMVHQSVEPSGSYPELVGCLMYLMTCTRPDLVYPLSLLARYMAPGRHRKVHCSTSNLAHRSSVSSPDTAPLDLRLRDFLDHVVHTN